MNHIFTFHVGNLSFGIDILCVQEIVRYQPMTRVPLAHSIVRGLINLRGQIVMALDMRKGLGLPPSEHEDQMINVMVYDEGETVSLLVDGIGDVLALDPDRFESTPATLR
ncbi:MAG: chemotaxis protein CheW, partial [Myxococcota bacterium]